MPGTFYLIRHGESASNAGEKTTDAGSTTLTERGWQAARANAATFPHKPDRVITSRYIRTAQTAEPFLARFQGVPVEEWDIHEFTYMSAEKYAGTTTHDRRPHIDVYWKKGDPHFADGDAESFAQFAARCHAAIARMAQSEGITVAFTHGHMIRGILHALRGNFDAITPAAMETFWRDHHANPIANCARFVFDVPGDGRVIYCERQECQPDDQNPQVD
ncbi:MAG TPA: histidine phosphatase family protein [Patescibacteria group bacterium]|nr:histidine phosphatase family protein [Patescibacteria group bacterium]